MTFIDMQTLSTVVVDRVIAFARSPHSLAHPYRAQLWRRQPREAGTCRAQRNPEWRAVEVQGASKVRAMLDYVDTVEPTMVNGFSDQAPACVVDAIRSTVCGIIGMLPPQFFEVSVRSQSTSLEQLLYTHLLHGFMFKKAMIRVDLKSSLALPSATGNSRLAQSTGLQTGPHHDSNYAPGTQLSNVEGDVLKWHHDLGTQSIPAQQYIQQLEAEVSMLRQQQAERAFVGQENVLINEIQELGANAATLTQEAGDDVQLAFRHFVERQLGADHQDMNPLPECTANELALLLFYTMAVGYTLASMHVSYGIASSLDVADYDGDF